jgi:hypothetical protein
MVRMAQVRGTLVLNTIEFVRENYGPPALPELLRTLPARIMLADLPTATCMARTLWRSLLDEGTLEVASQDAGGGRLELLRVPPEVRPKGTSGAPL